MYFSCTAGIEFLDVTNLEKCLQFYHKENHAPGRLVSISPSEILYEDMNSNNLLHRLDCSTSSPVCVDMTNLIKAGKVQEFCYLNGILVFVCEGCPGIYAQTLSGESLWNFEQVVIGRYTYNMKCISVTMDDNGHVFVVDTNHDCIRLFTIDGEYRSCLVRKGQHSIKDMKMIRYCKKTSSVIIDHWESVYSDWRKTSHTLSHIIVLKVNDS